MTEPVAEIPNRPAFKPAEVCEIAGIPPYVLKSWEKEFPGLGTETKPGGPRVYRRADVEQVMRIKHLLFAEGLTLAGARRKLEGEPKAEESPFPDLVAADELRTKVVRIKRELRSLLDLLRDDGPETVAPEPTSVSTTAVEQPAPSLGDEAVGDEDSRHSWPPARSAKTTETTADPPPTVAAPASGEGELGGPAGDEPHASADFLLDAPAAEGAGSRKPARSRRISRKGGSA